MSLNATKAAEKLESEAQELLSVAQTNEQESKNLDEEAAQGEEYGLGPIALNAFRERSRRFKAQSDDGKSRAESKIQQAEVLRDNGERYQRYSEHGDPNGSV